MEVMMIKSIKIGTIPKMVEVDGRVRIKAGDRIIFASYAGSTIKIDGDEHIILSEEDILAIVK